MTATGNRARGYELLDRGSNGDIGSISQLITAIESRSAVGRYTIDEIYARAGKAHIIGVTGAPGSGKSTLVSALVSELRTRGVRVAIVAVDPSSSISGGAILGDRIRMTEHTLDPNVFVRSMSSRGLLGGLSRATFDVVAVLDATGWDVVVVETVGVGQAEIEIVEIAQTTVVVSVPGLGDDIQILKAGLLEVADLHVVNKIDRPDSNKTISELLSMLKLSLRHEAGQWVVPVLGTSATSGQGVAQLADTLAVHREWLIASPKRREREWSNAVARVRAVAKELVIERMLDPSLTSAFQATIDEVVDRRLHPAVAAARLLDQISDGHRDEGRGE